MEDLRYLVFASNHYEALGGLSDLISSFATEDQAIAHARKDEYDSYQIYDRLEGIEISFIN